MLPEERARIKIDKQLNEAGWDIVTRNEYVPKSAAAVKEALMQGNTESDYLLFVDDKAIAVVEAKREENPLADDVENQAEGYSSHPQGWYGLWFDKQIPLVYLANGNKIYFKNMLTDPDGDYIELSAMHSPKKMLQIIGKKSEYGALPRLAKRGLRDCQYDAEANLEASLKVGKKKALSILATGSGKTYLACLASYRLLNYTPTKRVLFLVDRNNLARQAESEFSLFDRTEDGKALSELYRINRLKKAEDIKGDVVISTIQKLFAVLTGQAIPDETDEDREDEFSQRDNEKALKETVSLDGKLLLPPDYFQFIVIDLLEHLAHGEVTDENLELLRDYCSTINHRYEDDPLLGKHLDYFVVTFGFAPRTLANSINEAIENSALPPYTGISEPNSERKALISCLISNISARKKLLEMQKGYIIIVPGPDEVIYAGFSKETARTFIESFEKYLNDNKDSVEALRIIYNSENVVITHDMLCDLRDKLISENRLFTPYYIWNNYKILDVDGNVEQLDTKQNVNALTHLIQLVRYAFRKNPTLSSLYTGCSQRFNLYCGQMQRSLTDEQVIVMKQITDYIVSDGAFTVLELNSIDTDLWRKGVGCFGKSFALELQTLSRFILKVA